MNRRSGNVFLVVFASAALAAPVHLRESAFHPGPDGKPAGWSTWSARAETAPRCFVDTMRYRSSPGSLAISGASNIAEHGGWERRIAGIEAGAWYRAVAYYRTAAVEAESLQVVARLDWQSEAGRRAGEPDYIYKARRDGAWTQVTLDTQAPANAASVVLQLYLSNSPQGTVWWDDISLEQIPAPGARSVAVASINLKPSGTKSSAESVRQFLAATEAAVHGKTDLILFPEGITVVGTGKSYAEVAESI